MGARLYQSSATRVFDAPRAVLWGLVADTNRWDRAAGLTPGDYRWRQVDGRRERVATAKEMWLDLEWVEPPYEWAEGGFVAGRRSFLRGPTTGGGIRVELEDAGRGRTAVTATFHVRAGGATGPVIGGVMKVRFRKAIRSYFDALDRLLGETQDGGDPGASEPPVVVAHRALVRGPYDPVTGGRRTPPDAGELERRGRALREAAGDADGVDRLLAFLRDRPDEDVAQMRPFELARAWTLDRRAVLAVFLHAARAGLVDLRWQINCPVCRVGARFEGSLSGVRREVHCEACNVEYGVDFGEHVEAVFASNAAVRPVSAEVHCASSPAFRPHVAIQLAAPAGGEREEATDLPRGEILVRNLRGPQRREGRVDGAPCVLVLRATADDIEIEVEPADQDAVRVVNETDDEAILVLERAEWRADAVLGSVVATFPDFLDLFATEAPASGVDLSVGHIALLFTDLTGSTALYQQVGDARAFALVQEHFRLIEAVVLRHGGAVVKTMGDAVMASFPSAIAATAAALDMVADHEAGRSGHALGVKIGLHPGPCLVVRANDRIDFFGTTVNLAARLQAKARGGHLVVTEDTAAVPAIAALLEGRPARRYEAELRGISEPQRLVDFDLSGARTTGARR